MFLYLSHMRSHSNDCDETLMSVYAYVREGIWINVRESFEQTSVCIYISDSLWVFGVVVCTIDRIEWKQIQTALNILSYWIYRNFILHLWHRSRLGNIILKIFCLIFLIILLWFRLILLFLLVLFSSFFYVKILNKWVKKPLEIAFNGHFDVLYRFLRL